MRALQIVPLALIIVGLSTYSRAQPPPQRMKTHRVQAGEADASGWVLASSTEGGFTVRLPVKYNDFTMVEDEPSSVVLRMFTVGGVSDEGVKFSATRVEYRKGGETAKEFFSKLQKGAAADVKGARVAPRKGAGRAQFDERRVSESATAFQRVILLERDLVLLIVEFPSVVGETAPKSVKTFLDSFKLTRPPPAR